MPRVRCCCIPLFDQSACVFCMSNDLAELLTSDGQTTDDVTPNPDQTHGPLSPRQPAESPAGPKPKKQRMHWLDNAKTFLVLSVILGHTGMAMWGTGAGLGFGAALHRRWFDVVILMGLCVFKPLVVPLFFFISCPCLATIPRWQRATRLYQGLLLP